MQQELDGQKKKYHWVLIQAHPSDSRTADSDRQLLDKDKTSERGQLIIKKEVAGFGGEQSETFRIREQDNAAWPGTGEIE